MPYKSESQRRLMESIRHGWKPSRIKNPPSKKVAEEYHNADKQRAQAAHLRRRRSSTGGAPVGSAAVGG